MPERALEEYVAACKTKDCCPLGAAMGGHPRRPHFFSSTSRALGIAFNDTADVACAWDCGKHTKAIRLAISAGLGPLMDRYLFPPSPSASRQERGGSEGSEKRDERAGGDHAAK